MTNPLSNLVEELILARLLVNTEKRTERGRVRAALEALAGHRLSASEWKGLFDGCLDRLHHAEAITLKPLALTEAGRRRALAFLGVEALPASLSWATVKKRYLAAKALGLGSPDRDSRKRLEEADGLRGAILAARHRLAIEDSPTIARAAEALAWRQLGVETDRPFNKTEVVALLLYRAMNLEPPAATVASKAPDRTARNQAVLKAIGAKIAGGGQLHDALLRHWIDGLATASAATPPQQGAALGESADSAASGTTVATETLRRFAQRVVEAATSCRDGRFGDRKVFISHVWKKLMSDPEFAAMELAQFQERLTEAHRLGLLHLSQADLVEAMDPRDVAESETPYRNMAFHFIRI